MLKEIHEQADAVAETLADRLLDEGVHLGDIGISDDFLRNVRRIVIVACGTSYHAGLVGRYSIETWSRIPVEMDVASEFRYRNPLIDEHDLVIGISQSGETADTLAAMRLARERGAKVLAVTNIMGSQATRDADGVIFTRAGLEIGVAATKTFVAQVVVDAAVRAQAGGPARHARARGHAHARERPAPDAAHDQRDGRRGRPAGARDRPTTGRTPGFFLYLGRHVGLSICLEGALKLKEISYIPTDAYAAGEMKHGPIALLDERTPVVCVATDSPVLDKVMSNIAEVQARGAHVVAVATEGTHVAERRGGHQDPAHGLAAAAAARDRAAPAAGLPHRPRARAQRRPAAQPRQDRHRRVASAGVTGVGIDLLDVDRLERALARRPRLAERVFTDGERAYAPAHARPALHLAARFCAKEAVAKALGMTGWSLARRGGDRHRRGARGAAQRARGRPRRRARRHGLGVADPHRHDGRRRGAGGMTLPDWLDPLYDAAEMRASTPGRSSARACRRST